MLKYKFMHKNAQMKGTQASNLIHRIQDKNNCEDLFARVKINKEFIYMPISK